MGRGKGTPGANGTAVCHCSLQLCQVELCSLCVSPDFTEPLKVAANVASSAKFPNSDCPLDSLDCLQEKISQFLIPSLDSLNKNLQAQGLSISIL